MDATGDSMWTFSNIGFYSVVEHRQDKKLLYVRARMKGDLERLRDAYLKNLGEVEHTPSADYPYRALAWREDYAEAMKQMVLTGVDYPNFKGSVTAKIGSAVHDLYMRVWSVMRDATKFLEDHGKKVSAYSRQPELFSLPASTTSSWRDSSSWRQDDTKAKSKIKNRKGAGHQKGFRKDTEGIDALVTAQLKGTAFDYDIDSELDGIPTDDLEQDFPPEGLNAWEESLAANLDPETR